MAFRGVCCVLLSLSCCRISAFAAAPEDPFIIVLGIAQDAGFPQAGCSEICCRDAWNQPELRRMTACLAIVDRHTQQRWIIDCTPDFPDQLRLLDQVAPRRDGSSSLNGILLTHAHDGHYAGLIHLGREVLGAEGVPVYAMPRMTSFLQNNGPWSQLVTLKNIRLRPIVDRRSTALNDRISVKPLLVPHRDEFSETVGFLITGPNRKVLFIPDIDKWSKWSTNIDQLLQDVDIAYLDGTFYRNGEISGRDMSLIPHPFIEESLHRFSHLSSELRSRIRFIHFNHTNEALHSDSAACRQVIQAGLNIARQGEQFRI